MPLNEKKTIEIILEQCVDIEERYNGYREALIDVIADILKYERSHRVSATNIQTKINDKCNAASRFLVMQHDQDTGTEEPDT